MNSRNRTTWVRRALVAAASALLTASLLAAPATGQTTDCPTAMPTSELRDGMVGTGTTVADGRTRETFSWEYLGTLQDALGPGRDLIIVDTSGPVIERHGGIFYGMSGSPLFFGDGRLVGAVAYGLSGGPSSVAGITPGEDIMRVLNYPVAPEDDPAPPARTSEIPWQLRTRIATENAMQTEDVGSSFSRLRVPVGISGVGSAGIERITRVSERERLRLVPHQASSVGASQTTGEAPQPGDNLSSVLAYGDITYAGTGTLTVVCDGKFVAFGHPFFWEGETTFAGHAAETITVIEDTTWGSYELANVAEHIARIDQDRLAGLRGLLGATTPAVPITSTVNSPDTGLSRDGQTTVVDQEPVPFLAFYHLYSNILVTLDEYSGGSATGAFTISGTTEDGTSWDLTRNNVYASDYSIASESAYELETFLHSLLNNPFEDVEFTGVDADFTVQSEAIEYEIDDVLVAKNGGRYEDRRRIRVDPGDLLKLKVLLLTGEDEPHVPVELSLRIPRRARGRDIVEISAPRVYEERLCFYRPQRCVTEAGDKVDSLEEFIQVLESRSTNNALRASLQSGRSSTARDEEVMDRVVSGRIRVTVTVGCCSGGGGGEASEPKY